MKTLLSILSSITLSGENIIVFGYGQIFDEMILLRIFNMMNSMLGLGK